MNEMVGFGPIGESYLQEGFIICDAADAGALEWIVTATARIASEALAAKRPSGLTESIAFLDNIHTSVSVAKLNDYRVAVIEGINSLPELRSAYFAVARPFLEEIVGNELAMQQRVNLSIQMPNDSSSLLAVHADTWSGVSAYEVVVWLPLVDCYGTKAMYLLPPAHSADFESSFAKNAGVSSETIFAAIADRVRWLEIRCGQVMVFDQSLPHGNRVNLETETRWSMNCRFKAVFTPYGDKKLGEFFEPISLRPASRRGMTYRLPRIQ